MKPRPNHLRSLASLLALSVSSPLVASSSSLAPAAAGIAPPAQAVLVMKGGEALNLGAAPWQLDDAVLGRADHAWVWSSASAPERTEPPALPGVEIAPAKHFVELSVPKLRPGEASELGILAAPVAMWAEVPEEWLPRFPVGKDGAAKLPIDPSSRWRVRLIGAARGSTWIDLPPGARATTVFVEPADSLDLHVVSASGGPVPRVGVSALATKRAAGDAGVVARFVGDDEGRITIPGLPRSASLKLVLSQQDCAPLVLAGTIGQLPRRVVLDSGERLRGRVVRASAEGPPAPIGGAAVTVEAWLAGDIGALFRRTAATADDGTWEVAAVPSRTVMVEVRAAHLVPWSRRLELDADDAAPPGPAVMNLGDIVLQLGATLQVTAVDDLGQPIAGARIEPGPPVAGSPTAGRTPGAPIARIGVGGLTDPRGQLRLEAIAEGEPLLLRATAAGHLPAVEQLAPPLPERMVLRMVRTFRVGGRFVDADGGPIGEASVRVQRGGSFRDQPLEPDGTFALELPPKTPAELIFTSPATATVTVPVPAGDAGEVHDLGEIRALKGLTVAGQLLDLLDGAPVAGARVWTPRRMEGGPLVAWMLGQVIETTSDADGRFALAGLDLAPDVIRIDAPSRARLYLPVQPKPGATWIDAGELWLEEGAAVRLSMPVDGGQDRGQVRIDLRNQGLEIDMVTAPIYDGAAVVEHLPPRQESTVSVLRGASIVCEQRVDLPDNGETVDVDCTDGGMEVSGTVTVGGEPVAGGALVWSSASSDEGAAILTSVSPLGLRRQTVAGAGRPPVYVDLNRDGGFVTHDLVAGSWRVTWYPPGGGTAAEMTVEIPVRDSFTVLLEVPARTVKGRVLDPEDQPVSGARVRELTAGVTTLSGPDGTFSLTGFETDTVQLEARTDGFKSPVATVETPPGQSPSWVELRLDESRDDELIVQVVGSGGDPKGGALVLLEDDNLRLRLLTADRDGRAKAPMPPPAPTRIRVAAVAEGVWAFGAWQGWDPARPALVVEIGDAGTAVISTDKGEGSPVIESPSGWDVSGVLTRVGLRPFVDPKRPLYLAGLPVGRYQVRLGEVVRTLSVEGGEIATVELP